MSVLDLGCGPASITVGLGNRAVGVDLDPGPASVPLVRADISVLPFPDASFDGVFCCAVMQHLTDPLAVLIEARRVCRPGAVIGVADADWGGALRFPEDPALERGQPILERLRDGSDPYVGRRLRGLLNDAGFVRVTATAKGFGGGDSASTARQGAFQAAVFEAPETVALVVDEGIADTAEMATVADAWRRWGEHPAAVSTGWWFEAIGWAD